MPSLSQPQVSLADSPRSDRLTSLLLWVVIALAAAIRLFGVFTHPVDQDELYTVMESTDLYQTSLAPGIQSRPLYYLMQHALFWITPAHEPWTRLMPVVFGVLTVWLVAKLATKVADERAGLVAALVAACSPWHVYASEMARYYAMVGFLVTLTTIWVIDARDAGTAAAWRKAAIPVAIGILVHPTFVLGVMVLLALGALRGSLDAPRWQWPSRAVWTGFVPLAAASSALLLYSVFALGPRRGVDNGGVRMAEANLRLLPAIIEWASPIVVVAGGLGLLRYALRGASHAQREMATMIAAGSFSTLAMVVFASQVTATYADYAIGMLPGIFVGVGLLSSWITDGRFSRSVVVGLLAVSGLAPSLASHMLDGTRFDFRPAFADIRRIDANRLTLVWPAAIAEHYAADLRRERLDRTNSELTAVLQREGRLFVALSEKRYGVAVSNVPELQAWIRKNCQEYARYERPRFDFRMYRVSLQQCALAVDSK